MTHPTSMLCALVILMLAGEHTAAMGILFGTPRELAEINSPSTGDFSPTLSPNGLELHFMGFNRSGGKGVSDLWVATREHVADPFQPPTNLGPLNAGGSDSNPDIAGDGITLVFDSDRRGGYGDRDLWMLTRPSPTDPWRPPVNLGETVNSRGWEGRPSISEDGLTLIFDRSHDRSGHTFWMSTRTTTDGPFGPPVDLAISGSSPSISPDGLSLFFMNSGGFGQFDIYVATRASTSELFGQPVNLGPGINTAITEGDPDVSPDGATLYFMRTDYSNANDLAAAFLANADIWEVPIVPFEAVALHGGGDTYRENFDQALGTNGSETQTMLPTGWTSSDNGVVFSNVTTQSFPATTRLGRGPWIYNAGPLQDPDRSLAIAPGRDGGVVDLLVDVTESDAIAFQLRFDVEAWDAARGHDLPGEAAFDVTVQADTGNGFIEIANFGTVTTGTRLLPPAELDFVDGNAEANRISFNSNVKEANIPTGSKLRIRWNVPTDAETTNWVYGLDNVVLSLFGEPEPMLRAGDADQDLDFDQLDLVQVQVAAKYLTGEAATWGEGDWNGAPGGEPGSPPIGDGVFNQLDIVAAQQAGLYLKGSYAGLHGDALAVAVPEPSSAALLSFGLLAVLGWRRQRHRPLTCVE